VLRELTRGFDRRRILLTCGMALAAAGLLCVPGMTLAPFADYLIGSMAFSFAIALALTVANNLRQSRVPALVLNVAAVVVASLVVSLLLSALKQQDPLQLMGSAAGRQAIGSLVTLGLVIGAAMAFVLLLRERQVAEQAQHEARERLLEKQVLEAKLKTLQAQVEPHFLFNTLASVQRLVATDPQAASSMLDDLNQYLRASLPNMREDQSSVGREVDMARAYLNIMQVRMGQRLRYRVDLPAALRDQAFPPMMLLSLVENAVEHGVGDSGDGEVRIEAVTHGASIELRVSDNGVGFDPQAPAGVGLSNIRDRLAALYGTAGSLSLEEQGAGGRGVTARIRIPHDHAPTP
jgi:signal transduction histidine kinase